MCLIMGEKSCWGYAEQECKGKGRNAKEKANKEKGPLNFVSQHGIATVTGPEKEATTSNFGRENGIASESLRL